MPDELNFPMTIGDLHLERLYPGDGGGAALIVCRHRLREFIPYDDGQRRAERCEECLVFDLIENRSSDTRPDTDLWFEHQFAPRSLIPFLEKHVASDGDGLIRKVTDWKERVTALREGVVSRRFATVGDLLRYFRDELRLTDTADDFSRMFRERRVQDGTPLNEEAVGDCLNDHVWSEMSAGAPALLCYYLASLAHFSASDR